MSDRRDPDFTDLPRFVQRRAYDKGVVVARIVRDPMRRFGQVTIEGTRVSPFDLAGEFAESGDERVAEMYDLTVEQAAVARAWLAAHPDCPNNRPNCRKCHGYGYVMSADEVAEARRVDQEVNAFWAQHHSAFVTGDAG